MCKQVEVIPVLVCRDHWPENSLKQAKVINYRLTEEHSQTFNEGLFLSYGKLYNKRIWKKVWIIPLRMWFGLKVMSQHKDGVRKSTSSVYSIMTAYKETIEGFW